MEETVAPPGSFGRGWQRSRCQVAGLGTVADYYRRTPGSMGCDRAGVGTLHPLMHVLCARLRSARDGDPWQWKNAGFRRLRSDSRRSAARSVEKVEVQ